MADDSEFAYTPPAQATAYGMPPTMANRLLYNPDKTVGRGVDVMGDLEAMYQGRKRAVMNRGDGYRAPESDGRG